MPDCIKNRALYSTCITVLAFIAFALACTATILPLWGYFSNPTAGTTGPSAFPDRGHFGPWQTCIESYYGKTKCGDGVTRFQPVAAVRLSGYLAILGVVLIGSVCILNILHLAMTVSREKVVLKFRNAVVAKFVLSIFAEIVSIIVGVLFALQTDDKENSYHVERGESFYLQIGVIIIVFVLFVTSLYDLIFSRKSIGDPTTVRDPTGAEATTFNNPGFREKKHHQRHGISMTEASGKPYTSMSGTNGSMISMSTVLTSDGASSVTSSFNRTPLRSSLKKPRVSRDPGSIGIHNPGFSGSSPPMPRKTVRIQTLSTAV